MKQFIKTFSTMLDLDSISHLQLRKESTVDTYSVLAYYYNRDNELKLLKMHEGSKTECGHVLGDIYDQACKHERVVEMINKLERSK